MVQSNPKNKYLEREGTNVAIKDASSIYIFEKNGSKKELVSFFDYANTFGLNISAEQIYALAKGVNKIAFDGVPEGTLTFEAEVLTEDLLKTKLGRDIISENANIAKREVLTVNSNAATITGTPIGDAVTVYELHEGSTVEHKSLVGDAVLSGKDLQLTGLEDGTQIAVYYLENTADVKSIKLGLGKESKNYEIRAKVLAKDTVGQQKFIEIVLDKAVAELNIELSLDATSPSSINTVFNLMANDEGDFGELIFL